jgi:hypothetical protein
MTTGQVMLVGLEPVIGEIELLLDALPVTFQVADDLEEALELAGVTGVDAIFVHRGLAGLDPVDAVAECAAAIGSQDLPIVFLEPEDPDQTFVIMRDPERGSLAPIKPGARKLGALLREIVTPREGLDRGRAAGNEKRVVERIEDIGYNSQLRVNGLAYDVQTEIHVRESGATVRTTAYERGRLVYAESTELDPATTELDAAERLARRSHDKAIGGLASHRGETAGAETATREAPSEETPSGE